MRKLLISCRQGQEKSSYESATLWLVERALWPQTSLSPACTWALHSHKLLNGKQLERCLVRGASLCYGVSMGFFAFCVHSGKLDFGHVTGRLTQERVTTEEEHTTGHPWHFPFALQFLAGCGWVGGRRQCLKILTQWRKRGFIKEWLIENHLPYLTKWFHFHIWKVDENF